MSNVDTSPSSTSNITLSSLVFLKNQPCITKKHITNRQLVLKLLAKEWCIWENLNVKENNSDYCPFGDVIGKFKSFQQFCELWQTLYYQNINQMRAIRLFVDGMKPDTFEENSRGGRFFVDVSFNELNGVLLQLIDGVLCKSMTYSYLIDGISILFQHPNVKVSLWVTYPNSDERKIILDEFTSMIINVNPSLTVQYSSHSAILFKPSSEEYSPFQLLKDLAEPQVITDLGLFESKTKWGDDYVCMKNITFGETFDLNNKIEGLNKITKYSGLLCQKTKHKDIGKKNGKQKVIHPKKKERRNSLPIALPLNLSASPFIPKKKRNSTQSEQKSIDSSCDMSDYSDSNLCEFSEENLNKTPDNSFVEKSKSSSNEKSTLQTTSSSIDSSISTSFDINKFNDVFPELPNTTPVFHESIEQPKGCKEKSYKESEIQPQQTIVHYRKLKKIKSQTKLNSNQENKYSSPPIPSQNDFTQYRNLTTTTKQKQKQKQRKKKVILNKPNHLIDSSHTQPTQFSEKRITKAMIIDKPIIKDVNISPRQVIVSQQSFSIKNYIMEKIQNIIDAFDPFKQHWFYVKLIILVMILTSIMLCVLQYVGNEEEDIF